MLLEEAAPTPKHHCGDNCLLDCVGLALSACPHAQGLQLSQTPALPGHFKPHCPGYAEQLLLDLFIEGHTLGTWDMPAHGNTTVHSITSPSYSTPTSSVWPVPGSGQVEGVWTVQAAVWLCCLSSLGQASGSELSCKALSESSLAGLPWGFRWSCQSALRDCWRRRSPQRAQSRCGCLHSRAEVSHPVHRD